MSTPTTTKAIAGGREDCWSEGATASLIEAWGERHIRCNRGNLRQNDWKEVADAVNSRPSGVGKPSRTDIQCKNRIDTLKKKYKQEKGKNSPSGWKFFEKLDFLVGPPKPNTPKPINMGQPNVGAMVSYVNPRFRGRMMSEETSESSVDEEEGEGRGRGEEEGEGDEDEEELMRVVRRERGGGGVGGEREAVRELARAIARFGEIYERVERRKQRQVMELERQRMEFAKEMELQRMNMLVEAQVEIARAKRARFSGGGSRSGNGNANANVNANAVVDVNENENENDNDNPSGSEGKNL